MKNPYVGPRSLKFGETLYGRSVEAARLFHLLLADRIVLFYSPSGAGKTSLLQAQLTPRLRSEGFDVIYDIRVGRKPATAPSIPVNRYVLGAILSIEEALEENQRQPLDALASMTLGDYLKRVRELRQGRKRLAVLFDQFEEIFSDPTDNEAKEEFFHVLGEILEDATLYVVFAMREDWIALLDDYDHLIPSGLKARQRLSLLTEAQAIEAIRGPAREENVDFKVAEQLAHDLSRTTIMSQDGSTREGYSFVEPVQLQVVCLTLWDKPRKDPKVIDNLVGVSVDNALADYYKRCIDEVVLEKTLADERAVREWFSGLITPRGIRAQVLLDEIKSAGLPNEAIAVFVNKHLVRSEPRGGRTWFELSHDRLVNPIRTSNAEWNVEHLSLVQRRAAEWEATGRKPYLLLRGRQLLEAKTWAGEPANAASLQTLENLFLETSKGVQTPLEASATDWDVEGRPEEKLLRGKALRDAERTASETGACQSSPEVRTFLGESRAAHKRRMFGIQFAIYASLITVLAIVYAEGVHLNRTAEVKETKEAAEDHASVLVGNYIDAGQALDQNTLVQAIDAQQRIDEIRKAAAPAPRANKVTIQYFVKPGDSPKLRSALADLGFEIEDARPRKSDPTNSIWYGPGVAETDVKLIAYAILRAGGELQTVQGMDEPRNGVVVGHNQRVEDNPPLTTDDIDKLSLGQLERPLADLVTDHAEGTITAYDPEKRTGTIDQDGETIRFRLPPGRSEVAIGDGIHFVVYKNPRGGKYAVNLKRVATSESSVD